MSFCMDLGLDIRGWVSSRFGLSQGLGNSPWAGMRQRGSGRRTKCGGGPLSTGCRVMIWSADFGDFGEHATAAGFRIRTYQ